MNDFSKPGDGKTNRKSIIDCKTYVRRDDERTKYVANTYVGYGDDALHFTNTTCQRKAPDGVHQHNK